MWIGATLLTIVLLFWLLSLWFRRGEDLSAWDYPVAREFGESITRPGGPSDEHRRAEADIVAMGARVRGMSRREILHFSREFMEELPATKEYRCEFQAADAGGVPAEWVLAPGADRSRRFLYLHGGAFIAGSPNSHRPITSHLSEAANAAVLAIDYRLMPENRRMDGIEDCRTAFRWILRNGPDGPSEPARLYVGGDSAGGNLSLVMSAWARDQGLRAPDAVIGLSPLADSTYSGPSIRNNLESDTMLGPLFGGLLKIPKTVLTWIYVLENRIRPSHPVVSPLFGDLSGLPPTLIQVSESEMLLDDARRYVNKARASGSAAWLQSWPGLLHVWQIFLPEVPEAREAIERIGAFIAEVERGNG